MPVQRGRDYRYQTLPLREVCSVEMAHLRDHFELAPKSALAESVVREVASLMESEGRAKPGELLTKEGALLPLIEEKWSKKLAQGEISFSAAKRHIEMEQIRRLSSKRDATVEDVWRLLNQSEVAKRRSPKTDDFLPKEPLDASSLDVRPRCLSDVSVPEDALTKATEKLVEEHGLRPAQAASMVTMASKIHAWCCPKVEELKPGQVVWLARSIKKARRADAKLFIPVTLTLLTEEEMDAEIKTRAQLKALKIRQIERITAEAWRQDAVLTTLDIELLTGCNPQMIRELLEAYHERFGILLPTAGTVLDMGSTMTHKAVVIEMALSGLATNEIARRICRTPEAVDSYIRTFQNVSLLKYHGFPEAYMARVTGKSEALIREHLALIKKHFPTRDELARYLGQNNILSKQQKEAKYGS